MRKKLCYIGISMHPTAYKRLSSVFDVTSDINDAGRIDSAVVYSPPDRLMSAQTPHLKKLSCHLCAGESRIWADNLGISVFESTLIWRTVAEHTLALMLAAARNLPAADGDIRSGKWSDPVLDLKVIHSGRGFTGKTLGIWGMGRIGKELAGMVRGFGMKVIYNDISRLSPEGEEGLNAEFVPLDELLSRSDFFILLLPLNDETAGIMDGKMFSAMKPGVIFVNPARAKIIDMNAFRAAMESGRMGGAALDVFWSESADQPDWIRSNPKIVCSPHLGGSTYECDIELVDALI